MARYRFLFVPLSVPLMGRSGPTELFRFTGNKNKKRLVTRFRKRYALILGVSNRRAFRTSQFDADRDLSSGSVGPRANDSKAEQPGTVPDFCGVFNLCADG